MPHLILIYIGGIVVTAGLAAASGLVAKLFYLAGCVALGVWSSRKNHWDYLLLTLWIAALSPFARRLVDLEAGWDATNIMLTAPFLVTAPMIPAVLQRVRTLEAGDVLFPGIVAICSFYGFAVAALQGNAAAGLIGLSDWGVPILYYFFIVAHRDSVPALLDRLPHFLTAIMLLLGAYGIWQFVDLPIWDRFWMESADVGAFGAIAPYSMRVFSTMNAPGPFSIWMMALIVLSFGFRSRLMPIARVVGLLALAFTSVRGSWGGLAVGLLILSAAGGRRSIAYAVGIIVGIGVLAAVVDSVPQIDRVISQRLETLEDIDHDTSFVERKERASEILNVIVENPFGVGLARLGRGAIADSGQTLGVYLPIDDGILEIFTALGWFFGFMYCGALIGAAAQCFRHAPAGGQQRRAALAAALACLSGLPFTNVSTSAIGVIMWTMFALTMAMGRSPSPSTSVAPVVGSIRALRPLR
jgi:O-Antigen ligase